MSHRVLRACAWCGSKNPITALRCFGCHTRLELGPRPALRGWEPKPPAASQRIGVQTCPFVCGTHALRPSGRCRHNSQSMRLRAPQDSPILTSKTLIALALAFLVTVGWWLQVHPIG